MPIIKLNDKDYNYSFDISEISLDMYLTTIEILSENEYETYTNVHGVELNRKEPKPKNERSDAFMKELYIKVIRLFSDIPLRLIKVEGLFEYLFNLLVPSLEEISQTKVMTDDEVESLKLEYNDVFYTFLPTHQWTFYTWATLEIYLRMQPNGNRYLLPICMFPNGVFDQKLLKLQESFDFFNKSLDINTSLGLYLYLNAHINDIKKSHTFIYNDDGSGEGGSHIKEHHRLFSWLDTIRSIAELGVFGKYVDVKNANMFEVLEYLNCSISLSKAEYNDSKIKK